MTADRGSSSSLSPRSGNDEMIATPAGPAPNTTTFPTLHSFHTYLHCLLSTLGFSWACRIYYQRRPFCITDFVCPTSCRLGLTPVLCTVYNTTHQYHIVLRLKLWFCLVVLNVSYFVCCLKVEGLTRYLHNTSSFGDIVFLIII